MDTRSAATRLKQMGILDIIAAVILVGMGVLFWSTGLTARVGGESTIQLAQALIIMGVLLVPLGVLAILHVSRRTAATTMAASIYACAVAVGSVAYTVFIRINQGGALAFVGLFGFVVSMPTLVLIRRLR